MVSPHLPPEQSANAILPATLGDGLRQRGIGCEYVAHPPASRAAHGRLTQVTYVPRRRRDWFSRTRVGAVVAGTRMARGARSPVRRSDLVHLHSNGFLIEVGQWLSHRYAKPYVITLYGTDISRHDASRNARFGEVVRNAACRVFYSEGLLKQARHGGLAAEPSTVIYAPVSSQFQPAGEAARRAARRDLGIGDEPLMLTVKRLHRVAGHEVLLDAMPMIVAKLPTAKLWLAGDGELRSALERRCSDLDIASHVQFLGPIDNAALGRYYTAADLFVLPSRVESWGTVMLEALASGTPVVTTDTMGGVEVHENFPDDVTVVPNGDSAALAATVCEQLHRRVRTSVSALHRITERFTAEHCVTRYLEVYEAALR